MLSAFLNPNERTVYLESVVIQMFRSAIVNELAYVMYWCSELSDKEIMRILAEYPEATINEMEE